MGNEIRVETVPANMVEAHVAAFSALLADCVNAGASINFVMPFSVREAELFWRNKVIPAAEADRLIVFAAFIGDEIVGSVQLQHDTPPNQPHRAEVAKLMVHPEYRKRGIARALLSALETEAAAMGRTLITLDTRTGDAAEPLYRSAGYAVVGTIPGFSRAPDSDRLDATTIMYKNL